ncbi:M55 family metallopeptidase [Nitratireductor pacificus]|uniref:Peptidase M55 n=1 Tax=Nitratireductor pacificus pht-3B TaxID=391937 RepID=K2MSP9_9HYPH|nr:M55 family metallopeptidase [Nitratireductor pacificus]EKF20407.1 peptidase M55 [Nitratireductor pacificus pht-3B]
MHIFISVDIEGVAGVCEALQGQRGNPEYEVARRLMTEEANAAIRGAFAGGATAVTVADSHGQMRNMIAADLDPRARLVSGRLRPLSMIEGLRKEHAGVVLIGYHAAADNIGVLAHTISGLAFRRIEVNGVRAGEPTLFGGHAAELGVPLLAVSGDDRLGAEIAEQFPAARFVEVKRAIGAGSSESLSPQEARTAIEESVAKAVKAAKQAPVQSPCKPPLTVTVGFCRQNQADAAVLMPFVERTGALEVRFAAGSHAEAIGVLSGFSLMASALG